MRKTLQELTISSAFMFGAVMTVPEHCKDLLERVLELPIARVEVSKEKSIVYNPEYKGVRLDVYVADGHNTHYNIEMQALPVTAIEKRARYYHGQVDMEILMSGLPYADLPDTYVIFICDFDPFGLEKYRYTMKKVCEEDESFLMEDGSHTIFLSTKGKNSSEVPDELVKFLKYVGAPLSESENDFEDDFVERLQKTVRNVKVSREMGARFMTFQELLNDERREGREEGREEGIALGERNLMVSQIKKKLEKNLTVEQIADMLELDVEDVNAIISELEF